jgi:hypothetical protein
VQSEDQFREKLRKIEALYAGARTVGEQSAAGAAAERIRRQFETASRQEQAAEELVRLALGQRKRGIERRDAFT